MSEKLEHLIQSPWILCPLLISLLSKAIKSCSAGGQQKPCVVLLSFSYILCCEMHWRRSQLLLFQSHRQCWLLSSSSAKAKDLWLLFRMAMGTALWSAGTSCQLRCSNRELDHLFPATLGSPGDKVFPGKGYLRVRQMPGKVVPWKQSCLVFPAAPETGLSREAKPSGSRSVTGFHCVSSVLSALIQS